MKLDALFSFHFVVFLGMLHHLLWGMPVRGRTVTHNLKCCPELIIIFSLNFSSKRHTKHKKLPRYLHIAYSRARFVTLSGLKMMLNCNYMHSRAIQCKHTPYSAVVSQLGKGRQRNMHVQYGYFT